MTIEQIRNMNYKEIDANWFNISEEIKEDPEFARIYMEKSFKYFYNRRAI